MLESDSTLCWKYIFILYFIYIKLYIYKYIVYSINSKVCKLIYVIQVNSVLNK